MSFRFSLPRLVTLFWVFAIVFQGGLAPLTAQALGDGDDLRQASQQVREERDRQAARAPAAPASTTRLTPVTPELAVPIPGVTLTAPIEDGDDIVVPFMAQYISGLYRYLLGISTLVAIIVVIYGGFLYLVGQTTGSAQTGLKLIKDAIAGLVVLYASYIILWTVNPNLVNLQPIRLARIQSVPIAENSGDDGDFSELPSTGGAAQCTLRYNQGQSPWNQTPYGDSPALISGSTDTRAACTNHADTNGNSCFGTFQESGCGPTAVASVLAFYGLQVSVSARVPSPGTAAHTVDPIDVGIFAIKKGYRRVGRGTTGQVASNIDEGFPQFQTRTISKTNTQEILNSLRAGHPLVFACRNVHLYSDDAATQPITSRRTGSDVLYSPGHYMVLSGVVNDQLLRVHDVGNSHTKTIRMQELQTACGSPVEIKPKANAPETATATWGTGANAITVQMRLPSGAGGQCSGTAPSSSGPQTAATGEVVSFPFTYRPSGQSAAAWPDNAARVTFPQRLRSEHSPRVRIFIYLHGNNSGDQPPESRYLPYLQHALQRVAATKNIVILTPHHNQAGDRYPGFNLNEFYENGVRALHSVIPDATVQDVVVGGHSGATCNGGPVLLQALDSPISGTRGVIAYDGCLGDVFTPENAGGGSGISLYLNPDASGMGNNDPSNVAGNETRIDLVRRLWGFGDTPKTCPACVATAGVSARCYGQSPTFARPGGGELISFETNVGHGPSVETMTNIAFCAFYH